MVIVPIVLALFGGRKLNVWIWAGALAALAGLYFLTVPPEGLGGLNYGDPIVFGCAVSFAVHMIFIARHVQKHSVGALAVVASGDDGQRSRRSRFRCCLWRTSSSRAGRGVGTLVFAVLVTALGSTAFGFSAQTWAQQYTSPTHTAILISLEPVFAAITSWFVAHEHLTPRILLGAALIFVGIILAELKGAAPAAPESAEPFIQPET